jgi:glycosyltransferase involved in cell wall biosynthesis
MNEGRSHVAIFLPSLRGGGVEHTMMFLARGLVKRGYEVDMVLSTLSGARLITGFEHIQLVDLGARRVATSLLPLVRYLRRRRPAVLISGLDHANIIALLARALSGQPITTIVSVRNVMSQTTRHSPNLRERFIPVLARAIYPFADAVTAVSEAVREDLVQMTGLPRERITVIYNPIDLEFVDRHAVEPLQHRWFAQHDRPIVLGVGRLTPQKGFATLIRAFQILRQEVESRLLILGEGEQRAELQGMIQELSLQQDAELHGYEPNPFPYFTQADVFVLSSAWEGFARVILEAMACGTPVVSTDCQGGPTEIMMDGQYGRMVPVGDTHKLARAILETLREPLPSQVLRARTQDFSLDAILSQYIELMEAR